MNRDLHRHLDGELPDRELDEEGRREAQAWERLLDAYRVETPPGSAPPWLESKVMAEIESLPEPGILRRLGSWIIRPRPIQISPLTAGLAVAGLAALLLVGRPGGDPALPVAGEPSTGAHGASQAGADFRAVVYVQFALRAPGANSVAVAGDFDGWEGSYTLEDLDGDGTWTGRVPVRPGVHAYMFLVDGSRWMTDPNAERYADDGFGNRNAILAVAAPTL